MNWIPTPLSDTDKRIDQSLKLIKAYNRWKPLTCAYSGGKDSDVIVALCRFAHIQFDIVHNCTTIDPPYTLKHCLDIGATIVRPKYTFFELVEKKGLPSMYKRFCCQYLKERYISDCLVLGIRACESQKRTSRYVEPTACRIFSKSQHVEQVLPIVFWNNNNIEEFITDNNILLHPLYYDNGKVNVNKRLGCIGCPLQGDRGRKDYLAYPKFLKHLCDRYKKFLLKHHPNSNPYLDIVRQLFYSNHKEKQFAQTYFGLFKSPDPKIFLQNYFGIEL